MSADHTPYDQVLAALAPPGVNGFDPDTFRFACPVCESSDSISLKQGDNGVALVKCHAACGGGTEAYHAILDALNLSHLHEDDGLGDATVEALAEHLGIPEEWLQEAEWADETYWPTKGQKWERVAIPYPAGPDATPTMRYRNRLGAGRMKFSWSGKTKVGGRLYRGDELAQTQMKACVLAEGESDTVVARFGAGSLAVGLPGAAMWNEEEHAPQFAHLDDVFAVVDPDAAGEQRFLASLRSSAIAPKVRIVRLGADVRDFYLLDPATFKDRFNMALNAAKEQTFAAEAEKERIEKIAEAREVAGEELLHGDDLLDRLLKTYEDNGLVGEKPIAAAATLVYASSVSQTVADIIIKGGSSGGKSFAETEVREHVPESYYLYLTGASETSLYYMEPGTLKHKVLVIAEATGLESRKPGQVNGLAETIRVLQSEGRLDRIVTVPQKGHRPKVEHVHQEGPTGLIVTTTAEKIHPENETRALSLSIDDRREQTKDVMRSVAARRSGKIKPADKTQWHAFFAALRLECLGVTVVTPYAEALAELMEPVALRMRRDISTLFDFVEAHAILHYNIRERDEDGNLIATLADYEQVRKYLGAAFTETAADSSVRDSDRENVDALARVLAAKTGTLDGLQSVSVTELATELRLEKSSVSRRLVHTIEHGWIKNLETKPGIEARLVVGAPLPLTTDELLPTVEQVEEAMVS